MISRVKKPRIISIDFIRIFIISFVIASHVVAAGYFYGSVTSGATWMLTHTSRNLFLIITAFVLFYQYRDLKLTKFNIWGFYKHRFPLVFIPYATWTLIYQLQGGLAQHSVGEFLSVFWNNLVTSNAWYHLYFLLLTMQIYLIFPIVIWLYRKLRGKIKPQIAFAISCLLQIAITACMHRGWLNDIFSWWFNVADTNLLSYQLYVVMGLMMAEHWEKLKIFLLKRRLYIYMILGLSIAASLAIYFVEINSGLDVIWSSEVFQPIIAVESVLLMAALTAAGLKWVEKGAKRQKVVALIGANSFGIYLSHALIIEKLTFLQPNSHAWYIVLPCILISVPIIYGLAFLLSEFLRRTPFSVIFTGRKSIFKKTRLYGKLQSAVGMQS